MDVANRHLRIGEVARLSGLTTKALRYYDAIGLLHPVEVDEPTGYRRYDHDQAQLARQIRRLRELRLPLADMAVIINDPGSAAAMSRLKTSISFACTSYRSTNRAVFPRASHRQKGHRHVYACPTKDRRPRT